jgi:hypothetical protein
MVGYVCLVMTCLAACTHDHCDDEQCNDIDECHCACGLWGLSPADFDMPQPRPADRILIVESFPEVADAIWDLFRPPRATIA